MKILEKEENRELYMVIGRMNKTSILVVGRNKLL